MPAGLIEDHRHVLVLSNGFGEAIQEGLHCSRIRIRHHQREGVVRGWLDGSEDIGEGEALVGKPRRPLAALPPDVADAALLADTGFVLEEQAQALVFMRRLNFSQKRQSPF